MPASPQRASRSRVLILAGGVLLLLGAVRPVSLYLSAPRPLGAPVWSVPLPDGQAAAHLPFVIRRSGEYEIAAAVDETAGSASESPYKIGCLLGALRDDPANGIPCKQFGAPLSFGWRVTGPAGLIAEGRYPGSEPSGTVGQEDRKREFVVFARSPQLAPGNYVLEVSDLHLPAALGTMHPALEVTLDVEPYDFYKDWTSLFVTLLSAGVAFVGLVLLVLGLIPGAISRPGSPRRGISPGARLFLR